MQQKHKGENSKGANAMSDTKIAEKAAHRLLRLREPKDARPIAVIATTNHLPIPVAAERFYGTSWNWRRPEEKPSQLKA